MRSRANEAALRSLARVAARRFQSFAHAADLVLGALAEALPESKVAIVQLDSDDGLHRVIDSRGDGIDALVPRSTLRLGASARADDGSSAGPFDRELLESLAVQSYLSVPLEVRGSTVGIVCALSPSSDVYERAHAELLTVCARLLAYEWEIVSDRAELRRLSEAARAGERRDQETGLQNHTAFLGELDREWQLARRGNVESHVIVFELHDLASIARERGDATATLLLKDAGEMLGATVRRTDPAGRVAAARLAAVLVGCKGDAGVNAFVDRFRSALSEIWETRPARAALSWGSCPLAAAESGEDALALAAERLQAAPEAAGDREEPAVGSG